MNPEERAWVRRAQGAQRAIDALLAEAATNTEAEERAKEMGHDHGMVAKLTVIEERQDSIATVLICDCLADEYEQILLCADILIAALNDMKTKLTVQAVKDAD